MSMFNIKKGNIDNKLMEIVSPEEYLNNKYCYAPRTTAVEYEGIAYPVYESDVPNNKKPGFYVGSCISQFVEPSEEEKDKFSVDNKNNNIVDFSDINSASELIEKTNLLKDIEKDILTNSDNITSFPITDTNSPEMKAMKECINSKNINLDSYAGRFDNYNNTKRLIKNKDNITLFKILEISNALDLKCTLLIEDKSPDVPNPMKKTVTVVLNVGEEGDNNENE